MTEEWIGIPDGVHRAKGQLTRWELYTLAMQGEIESRRQGRVWQVSQTGLDKYLRDLKSRTASG